MDRALALLFLLANLLALNCQEEESEKPTGVYTSDEGKPSYSFSYGVSDARTGDIKTVWESKEGDTVKGHYSVLEPDGSMRTVEYSAGPKTGFTAVVNNENIHTENPEGRSLENPEGRSFMEEKAMRDYGKYYDFSEDADEDYYENKRAKHPLESLFKDYSIRKKPKYPYDLEPSEYTHSISIKHPRDESSDTEAHSHVGYSFDPNCKTKTRKESNEHKENLYSNIVDLEMSKTKNPIFSGDSYKEPYDKYAEASNYDFEKYKPFSTNSHKGSKYDDNHMKPSSPTKYTFPSLPDVPPPDRYYPDEIPQRPKKKNRPYKLPEFYPSDDLDDYILVPKKKYKPSRVPDLSDYKPDLEDDYDRPQYGSNSDDQDDRYPTRGNGQKEVIRKVIKKRRPPVINLLDMFDI
ncbi:hypothetical protein O3G_MSEX013228 [Manduca sexta]|uniref:Cuticle protein n=2 Tax=Manduca sexta TaxID=7130 RepID=A0A922CWR4_MANSE|nr:hypothetical protein O3G_MSEX013228 [Manduca sexta]KAG6462395.1 hypothetical protein O3G_MSEX013228 [Manduca sexta]